MDPRTLVSPGQRLGALLVPSAIPCSLSSLISRIHSCLFSDWKHIVSSKFFDTQVPSISTEELVLLRHACCVLSHLRCIGHKYSVKLLSLSNWQNRKSFLQHPRAPVPGHLSSHSALSSYGLFESLALWQFSVSVRPLVRALESYPASGASNLPPSTHPSKGVG